MYKYTYQLVNINKNLFTSQVTYIFVNLDIKKKNGNSKYSQKYYSLK